MIDLNKIKDADLQLKIDNLKAERERTAETLKRYEAEMAERNRRVPLGVPQCGNWYVDSFCRVDYDCSSFATSHFDEMLNAFSSKESAERHAEMLKAWRKALVANAKGEPIDIEVLKPLLRKGWVAMDKDESWGWFSEKPRRDETSWMPDLKLGCWRTMDEYYIKPADDWKKSLQECGL